MIFPDIHAHAHARAIFGLCALLAMPALAAQGGRPICALDLAKLSGTIRGNQAAADEALARVERLGRERKRLLRENDEATYPFGVQVHESWRVRDTPAALYFAEHERALTQIAYRKIVASWEREIESRQKATGSLRRARSLTRGPGSARKMDSRLRDERRMLRYAQEQHKQWRELLAIARNPALPGDLLAEAEGRAAVDAPDPHRVASKLRAESVRVRGQLQAKRRELESREVLLPPPSPLSQRVNRLGGPFARKIESRLRRADVEFAYVDVERSILAQEIAQVVRKARASARHGDLARAAFYQEMSRLAIRFSLRAQREFTRRRMSALTGAVDGLRRALASEADPANRLQWKQILEEAQSQLNEARAEEGRLQEAVRSSRPEFPLGRSDYYGPFS